MDFILLVDRNSFELTWRYLRVTPEDILGKLSTLWACSSRSHLDWAHPLRDVS